MTEKEIADTLAVLKKIHHAQVEFAPSKPLDEVPGFWKMPGDYIMPYYHLVWQGPDHEHGCGMWHWPDQPCPPWGVRPDELLKAPKWGPLK